METKNRFNLRHAEEISNQLDLGEILKYKEISHRRVSRTKKFLIETEKGRFLAKFYEKNIPAYLDFLQWVHDRGLSCPRILDTSPRYSSFSEDPFLIYSFLEGKLKDTLQEEELEKVGGLLSELHDFSDDYLYQVKYNSEGIVHGDLGTHNLVTNQERIYLIDFDEMKIRPYMRDVADFMFYYELKQLQKEKPLVKMNAFVESYKDGRKINFSKSFLQNEILKRSEWFLKFSKGKYEIGHIDINQLNRRQELTKEIKSYLL